MFIGVFKDRSAEQALAELLSARELRSHSLSRQCEIGPFLIDYVFPQRSLIVELLPGPLAADAKVSSRQEARARFLVGMGYVIHGVSPQELLRQPRRVLARLCDALEGRSC